MPVSLSVGEGAQLLDGPPLNPVQALAQGSQPLVTGRSGLLVLGSRAGGPAQHGDIMPGSPLTSP